MEDAGRAPQGTLKIVGADIAGGRSGNPQDVADSAVRVDDSTAGRDSHCKVVGYDTNETTTGNVYKILRRKYYLFV